MKHDWNKIYPRVAKRPRNDHRALQRPEPPGMSLDVARCVAPRSPCYPAEDRGFDESRHDPDRRQEWRPELSLSSDRVPTPGSADAGGGKRVVDFRDLPSILRRTLAKVAYNAFMDKRLKIIDPTEAEIAAACALFRRSWSPREHYRRSISIAGVYHTARSPVSRRRWYQPVVLAPHAD
jgi:hypothetical protein